MIDSLTVCLLDSDPARQPRSQAAAAILNHEKRNLEGAQAWSEGGGEGGRGGEIVYLSFLPH